MWFTFKQNLSELYYSLLCFKEIEIENHLYFIYENNKYFYCHNSWNATTCIWCNKLEVDKKQYINEKKVIVCKIFWPFYQIDTPWSALCFNSELVVLFQVQFWLVTALKTTMNITNVWKYFYVFTKVHILWEGLTNFKKIFLIFDRLEFPLQLEI